MKKDQSMDPKNEESKPPEESKAELAPKAAVAPKAEVVPEDDVELKVQLTVELEAKRGTRRISLSLETVRNLTATGPILDARMVKHPGVTGEFCGGSTPNCHSAGCQGTTTCPG